MANGTIAFDTLSTSGQITGTAKSLDTDYVVNGSFKHYVHYNHISDSVVKSFNLSSISDDAAGEYTVTMQNAMGDINYVILASCNFEANGESDARFNHSLNRDNSTGNEVAPTTTAYKVGTDDDSGNKDLKYCYSAVVGDLA